MKVSVIIPNYNHGRYLPERIESVLNQTFRDIEIIILDDSSTDNSKEIIEYYVKTFPEIISIYNNSNSGSPFNQWNKGAERASGEFIWIAESDDYAEPSFIERCVTILSENPNIGLAYCDSLIIDEEKSSRRLASADKVRFHKTRWMSDYINDGRDEIKKYLSLENTIYNASSVIFRKSKYLEAGMASQSMKYCGDWLMYIRVLLISDIAYINEPLNNFRIHSLSSYRKYYHNNDYLKESIKIYSFLRKSSDLTIRTKVMMALRILRILLRRVYAVISMTLNN